MRIAAGWVEVKETEQALLFFLCQLGLDLPRPGIEPGLEVPETSVMSFSLPGRVREGQMQKVSQARHPNKHHVAAGARG